MSEHGGHVTSLDSGHSSTPAEHESKIGKAIEMMAEEALGPVVETGKNFVENLYEVLAPDQILPKKGGKSAAPKH